MRGIFAAALILASGARAAVASSCDAPAPHVSGEVAELKAKLAEREAELKRAQAKLDAFADEERWYREAQELGVTEAVSRSGMTEVAQRRLAVAIVREAHANGVDPLLVVAVIRNESSFNNYAVSGVGAMGLMQMMPDTGTWLANRKGMTFRKNNLFDSELNVELGTAYLAQLIAEFGSVDRALVAYNAGPGLAKRILQSRDSRKKFMAGYPKKVIGEWHRLKAAHDRAVQNVSNVQPRTLVAEQSGPVHTP
jgi:soluble lytic murein transglycosylase